MASNKKVQTTPKADTEDSQVAATEMAATITTEAATEENNQDSVENAAEAATVQPSPETSSSTEEIPGDAKVIATTAVIEPPAPKATPNIHDRLTKLVRSITPHAGQEKVFALHQLELLTGRLKMMIPSAIAATDDIALRTDLESLLGLL